MKRIIAFARRVFSPIGPQWYLAALLVLDGLMVLHPVIQRVRLEHRGNWIDYVLQVINTSSLLVLPQAVVAVGSPLWRSGSCCALASRGCSRSCCSPRPPR